MTGRELFVALTRWIGVLVVIYGIYAIAYYCLELALSDLPSRVSSKTGLIFGGVYMVCGLALMFGAGVFARLTYGPEKTN